VQAIAASSTAASRMVLVIVMKGLLVARFARAWPSVMNR
jgi:hypothetical protein